MEERKNKKIKKWKKTKFMAVFVFVFLGSLWFFGNTGLAPQSVSKIIELQNDRIAGLSDFEFINKDEEGNNLAHSETSEKPIKIEIDKIGVSANVVNPVSRSARSLDKALKNGVVRYPNSGFLGSEKNVFLFGHDSSLPTVRNPMYKVFSKMRELNLGDDVKVYSKNRVYFYEVVNMALVDKEEALVEFDYDKHKLTLSTCNTFGEKSERFVVEANFVGSFPLD